MHIEGSSKPRLPGPRQKLGGMKRKGRALRRRALGAGLEIIAAWSLLDLSASSSSSIKDVTTPSDLFSINLEPPASASLAEASPDLSGWTAHEIWKTNAKTTRPIIKRAGFTRPYFTPYLLNVNLALMRTWTRKKNTRYRSRFVCQ